MKCSNGSGKRDGDGYCTWPRQYRDADARLVGPSAPTRTRKPCRPSDRVMASAGRSSPSVTNAVRRLSRVMVCSAWPRVGHYATPCEREETTTLLTHRRWDTRAEVGGLRANAICDDAGGAQHRFRGAGVIPARPENRPHREPLRQAARGK